MLVSLSVFGQDDANNDWWFNVEFIAFKRDMLSSNNEDFAQADFQLDASASRDLLTLPLRYQNQAYRIISQSLALCKPVVQAPLIEWDIYQATIQKPTELDDIVDGFAFDDYQLTCVSKNEKSRSQELFVPLLSIPQEIFADSEFYINYPHIISRESLELSDYFDKLSRQRDIQPLLYTAWRHNVIFGENNAEFYRIRAGNLLQINTPLTEQPLSYEEWLEENREQDSLLSNDVQSDFYQQLKDALESKQKINWLAEQKSKHASDEDAVLINDKWELDGQFKVYLDYINQVPYLHIEAEFKHHRLSLNAEGEAQISVYPFKQRRRIISKQIHYFDHPAFGIVVRLERFQPPQQLPPLDLESEVAR